MDKKLKIWHISDTHTFHDLLNIPNDIDMVIHSGDCSNPRNPYINENEVWNFIDWYEKLPIKYKIFVAGNHDTSIEKRLIRSTDFTSKGIIYLENTSICIEGLNIWGTPYTPTFGVGWAYNKSRDKMDKLWKSIPENVDIIISHGPPKGILDLSYDIENNLEFCGCGAMKKNMIKLEPKLVLFGHIHNCEGIINAGTMQLSGYKTIYSNGSVMIDGKFSKLSSNGNIFEI
jgi:Icc-related predicted phosphoesterase